MDLSDVTNTVFLLIGLLFLVFVLMLRYKRHDRLVHAAAEAHRERVACLDKTPTWSEDYLQLAVGWDQRGFPDLAAQHRELATWLAMTEDKLIALWAEEREEVAAHRPRPEDVAPYTPPGPPEPCTAVGRMHGHRPHGRCPGYDLSANLAAAEDRKRARTPAEPAEGSQSGSGVSSGYGYLGKHAELERKLEHLIYPENEPAGDPGFDLRALQREVDAAKPRPLLKRPRHLAELDDELRAAMSTPPPMMILGSLDPPKRLTEGLPDECCLDCHGTGYVPIYPSGNLACDCNDDLSF